MCVVSNNLCLTCCMFILTPQAQEREQVLALLGGLPVTELASGLTSPASLSRRTSTGPSPAPSARGSRLGLAGAGPDSLHASGASLLGFSFSEVHSAGEGAADPTFDQFPGQTANPTADPTSAAAAEEIGTGSIPQDQLARHDGADAGAGSAGATATIDELHDEVFAEDAVVAAESELPVAVEEPDIAGTPLLDPDRESLDSAAWMAAVSQQQQAAAEQQWAELDHALAAACEGVLHRAVTQPDPLPQVGRGT